MSNIIPYICVLLFLAICYVGWFIIEWNKQNKYHNRYLLSLRKGDVVSYINDDLEYEKGCFQSIRDKAALIIDNEGKTIKILTFQIIATNGDGISKLHQ